MKIEYDPNKDYRMEELFEKLLTEHLGIKDEKVKKATENLIIFSLLQ